MPGYWYGNLDERVSLIYLTLGELFGRTQRKTTGGVPLG